MTRHLTLLFLIATVPAWISCNQTSTPTESEWTTLFDGTSLDGWTPKIRGYELGEDPFDTFRLEENLIKVRYDQYPAFDETFGHLFYEDSISSYYLEMEYRFVGQQIEDGPEWAWRNSGIMLHSQDPASMQVDQDFPDSIELQLLGTIEGESRANANLCTPGTHVMFGTELETYHCIDSDSRSYIDDEWVTIGVLVHENRWFDHRLEGQSVLSYHSSQLDDGTAINGGYIALQSESHPLDIRHVRMRPLTGDEIEWAESKYQDALQGSDN
ncbi:MAG: 3-keto-disaccharide hydrolase [Bacteroidota bacterium]